MRRIATILSLLIFVCIPLIAGAQMETVTNESCSVTAPLRICSECCFDGMEQSYAQGYVPVVSENRAEVILPLLPATTVLENRINVTVDLGTPTESPFVFKNYDRPCFLEPHTDAEGTERSVFLVRFDLELTELRSAGRYPITITATGTTVDQEAPFSQSFTIYVTVPEASTSQDPDGSQTPDPSEEPWEGVVPAPGTDDNSGSVSDDVIVENPEDFTYTDVAEPDSGSAGSNPAATPTPTEKPLGVPRLLLTGYSLTPSPVLEGMPFSFTGTLTNMSSKQVLTNILVTITPEGGGLTNDGSPLSFWFEKVLPGAAFSFTAQLRAEPSDQITAQKITVECTYEGKDAKEYQSADIVMISVAQPARLEWDAPQIPANIHAGDTLAVPVQAMNLGKGTLYNLTARIEAPGLQSQNSLFLGNLESGASKKGDLYVYVSTLQPGADASTEDSYGATSGTVTLSAETEDNEPIVLSEEFTAEISAPVIAALEEPEEPPEEKDATFQWILTAVIIGWAATILVAFLVRKKRGERTY